VISGFAQIDFAMSMTTLAGDTLHRAPFYHFTPD
jgi:hypothetical protein